MKMMSQKTSIHRIKVSKPRAFLETPIGITHWRNLQSKVKKASYYKVSF